VWIAFGVNHQQNKIGARYFKKLNCGSISFFLPVICYSVIAPDAWLATALFGKE